MPKRMKKPDELESSNESSQHGTRKVRKPMTYVSDNMRLKMLLLITEFGLSCYMAAKVLDLPYTNAKVIYRVFREERRIVQNSRNPTGAQQFFEG